MTSIRSSATRWAGASDRSSRRHARGDGPARVANGDRDQLEGGAIGRAEVVGPLEQGRDDLASDGPGAQHRDAQAGTAHDGRRTVATSAEW